MDVALGGVIFTDGRPDDAPRPPAFPNGPVVHVFNNYRHAWGYSLMAGWRPTNPDRSVFVDTDGKVHRTVSVGADDAALWGLEPSAIVVHTPDCRRFRQFAETLAYRAYRARVDIVEDFGDPPRPS